MFPLKGKLVDMTVMFSLVERSVHTTGKTICKFDRLFSHLFLEMLRYSALTASVCSLR